MSFFKLLSKIGIAPAVALGNIVTAGLEKITGKKYGRTTIKEASETKFGKALGIATVSVAAAIPVAIAPAAAGRIASTVGKTVVKTAVKKPALAIVGTGVIVSGAAPTIVKTLFKAGKVGGEVITGEKALTSETIMDVAKGAGVVAGLGGLGLAVGVVGKKILEKKEAIPTLPKEIGGLVAQQPVVTDRPISPTPPITPETVSLKEPSIKKPSEPRRQQITQRVKVEVGVRQSAHRITQNYINALPY